MAKSFCGLLSVKIKNICVAVFSTNQLILSFGKILLTKESLRFNIEMILIAACCIIVSRLFTKQTVYIPDE